ncbi:MAG: thioredoxin family protein [Paracoccaceae bacterium]
MNRRDFMALSASTTLAAASFPVAVFAAEPTLYHPGLAEAAMDDGKVIVLDFWASWCSTCVAQDRVLAQLKAANPEYEKKIAFFRVDWDQYAKGDLSHKLEIPRRSTLVALKGRNELGRIIAGTSETEIQALLDIALAAAN